MNNRNALMSMAAGNFAVGIGSLVIAGVIQPMADEFNTPISAIGQLITIYAFAYAIGSPLLIAYTGQFERRTMLIAGLLLAMAGYAMTALAPNYTLLFIARIVTALGAAIFTPVASTVASLLVPPEERGKAIAAVFAGFAAATALGLPLGTFIGLNFGWRLTFWLVAVLAIVGVGLVAATVPAEVDAPLVNLAVFQQVLKNRMLVIILLVTLVQLAAQIALFTYIAPYVQSLTTIGATGITLLLLSNGVAGFIGNFIGGNLTDRIGARNTIVLFMLVMLAAFFAVPLIELSLVLGFVAFGVWGLVGLGFNAPQQARLVNLAPQYSSAVLGLNASFLYIGISSGSLFGGWVVDQGGLLSLHWVAAALTVAALAIFAFSWGAENNL